VKAFHKFVKNCVYKHYYMNSSTRELTMSSATMREMVSGSQLIVFFSNMLSRTLFI